MKVLIVEDNADLADNIFQYLAQERYICEIATSFDAATDKLLGFGYDAIILDIMLPDGNGMELLRFIKQEKIESNVLIISAKNALDDKLEGLNLGADDYLTKPFHLPELHARLRAIFRRNQQNGEEIMEFPGLIINTTTLEVMADGHHLDLTRKEYDLLLYFVTNKNRVISRQSIAEHLWGDYTDNLANFDFVYQHVKNLRKKLTAHNGHDFISTVYGLGYRFDVNKK